MFTGRWQATEPLDETWLDGRPELHIGHFGPELTGVVRYFAALGVLPQSECECGWLEGDEVDLDHKSFVARGNHCGMPALVWDLELVESDDDIFLQGTVGPSAEERVDITLVLLDNFVRDGDKLCTREPPE